MVIEYMKFKLRILRILKLQVIIENSGEIKIAEKEISGQKKL